MGTISPIIRTAKLLQIFDIRKFFSKKIAFLCIFLNYGIFRKTAHTTTLIAIDLIYICAGTHSAPTHIHTRARICSLTHAIRAHAKDNQQFIDILNQVRNNQLSAASRNLLNTRYQPDYVQTEDDFHIILSTHNQKVDQINERGLAKLPSEARTYQASIEGTFPESMFPNDAELTLKVGARVMFVKNDSSPEKRYYNGKLGIVTALDEDCITVACEDQTIAVTPEEQHIGAHRCMQ